MEYSITGRANSAAASRRMWTLSASSTLRWFNRRGTAAPLPLWGAAGPCSKNATCDVCAIGLGLETKNPPARIPGGGLATISQ